jgi:hypothetical protein
MPKNKSFEKLVDEMRTVLSTMVEHERGQLPYCDDPEDGCSELWAETVRDFNAKHQQIVDWCANKDIPDPE